MTTAIVSPRHRGGAELDDLRARVVDGRVAGRHVVRIAGLVCLLAVREAESDPSLEHVAPAGELAAVVGSPRNRSASSASAVCDSKQTE